MAKNVFSFLTLSAALLFVVACGDSDTLSKQQDQREAVVEELQGNWISSCEGKAISTLEFEGTKLHVHRTYHYDKECQERSHTLSQSGEVVLANNYKEGLNNSFIFTPANEVRATFHVYYEVDGLNNTLINFRNNVKESPVDAKASPAERNNLIRENLKIRTLQALPNLQHEKTATLSHLQVEKLNDLGYRLITSVAEFSAKRAYKYEFDNGHLQVGLGTGSVYVHK